MPDGRRRRKARSTRCSRAADSEDAARSRGAAGATRTAAYGIVDAREGTTAIIEAAEIVGITDADGMAVDVSARSTQASAS